MIPEAMRRAERTPLFYLTGNGIILGAIVAAPDDLGVFLTVVLVGIAVSAAGAVYSLRVSGRVERRLRDEARDGSAELVSGDGGTLAPAMVVRRRVGGQHPAFVAGQAEPVGETSVVTMLTALAPDGARLALALVPPETGVRLKRKEVVGVRLHPTRPDVAVLDQDLDAAQLAQYEADPRWQTETLPHTSSRGATRVRRPRAAGRHARRLDDGDAARLGAGRPTHRRFGTDPRPTWHT
jgi:hypothetical protein